MDRPHYACIGKLCADEGDAHTSDELRWWPGDGLVGAAGWYCGRCMVREVLDNIVPHMTRLDAVLEGHFTPWPRSPMLGQPHVPPQLYQCWNCLAFFSRDALVEMRCPSCREGSPIA